MRRLGLLWSDGGILKGKKEKSKVFNNLIIDLFKIDF